MTDLNLILDRRDDGELAMWACRGEGKGCKRNTFRARKKCCSDCLGPLPDDMTLEQVTQRLKQGDA